MERDPPRRSLHGIESILHQILDDPLEKIPVDERTKLSRCRNDEVHPLARPWNAFRDVGDDPTDDFGEVLVFQVGARADLGKAGSHLVEPFDVVPDFLQTFGNSRDMLAIRACPLKPPDDTGQRRAELMCGFLRHPHPDIALFRPFDSGEPEVGNEDKHRRQENLPHGKPTKLNDQVGFAVMNIVQHCRVVQCDLDRLVVPVHDREQRPDDLSLLIQRQRRIDLHVLPVQGIVVDIGEDDREVDGADHLFKEKAEIARGGPITGDVLVRFRVEIDDLLFMREEFRRDPVGIHEHGDDECRRKDEESDLEICRLHGRGGSGDVLHSDAQSNVMSMSLSGRAGHRPRPARRMSRSARRAPPHSDAHWTGDRHTTSPRRSAPSSRGMIRRPG